MNNETTKAAVDAARSFASSNPWAEAMARGFEAFTPGATSRTTTTTTTRKEKAAV